MQEIVQRARNAAGRKAENREYADEKSPDQSGGARALKKQERERERRADLRRNQGKEHADRDRRCVARLDPPKHQKDRRVNEERCDIVREDDEAGIPTSNDRNRVEARKRKPRRLGAFTSQQIRRKHARDGQHADIGEGEDEAGSTRRQKTERPEKYNRVGRVEERRRRLMRMDEPVTFEERRARFAIWRNPCRPSFSSRPEMIEVGCERARVMAEYQWANHRRRDKNRREKAKASRQRRTQID